MPYVDDSNGNGKRRGGRSLLGELATEYLGSTIANPFVASAFRVATRAGIGVGGSPWSTPQARPVAAPRPVPSINVVALPNGAVIPARTNGASPASAPSSYGMPAVTGSPADPYSGRGGMGPPDTPVEVGTLPPDDSNNFSTAGVSSLAGLTGSPIFLGLVALAAFMMLDGSKPKRRRR